MVKGLRSEMTFKILWISLTQNNKHQHKINLKAMIFCNIGCGPVHYLCHPFFPGNFSAAPFTEFLMNHCSVNCFAFLKSVQYFCLVLHPKVQCLPDFMHLRLCPSFSVSLRTWGYPVIWLPTKISLQNMNCLPFTSLWAIFLLPEGQERCPRPVSSSWDTGISNTPYSPPPPRLPCKKQHSSSALYLFSFSFPQIFHLPWFFLIRSNRSGHNFIY